MLAVDDDYSRSHVDENVQNFDSVLKVVVDHFEMVMIEMEYQHNKNQILEQLDHPHYVENLVWYQ